VACLVRMRDDVLLVHNWDNNYSGAPAAEGPPSGAPYSYRKEKETHELIFSWLSWLAV